MNKLVLAIALCTILAACKKQETAEDSATSAPADVAVVATEAEAKAAKDAPAVAGIEGLPKECEEYLNRAKACFSKAAGNGFAAQFQKGVDQAKEQWEQMADKSGLAAACKMANDQFTQAAATLSCE